MLKSRVQKLRAEVRIDTQKLRNQAIENLQELFTLAKEQAQNPNVNLKQRQSWARVAAYICQVINTVAARFDEHQIDIDLNKLEELISETTAKKQTQTA
jgi:hypothetical protein